MRRIRFRAGMMPLLLALSTGCAGIQRTEYLERRAGDHVIARPIGQVWLELQGLLRELGWRVERDGDFELITEWRRLSSGRSFSPTSRTETIPMERLVVVGTLVPEGGCLIQIARQERSWQRVERGFGSPARGGRGHRETGDSAPDLDAGRFATEEPDPMPLIQTHRDLDLEWALIRRVEPNWAAAHERVASDQYH